MSTSQSRYNHPRYLSGITGWIFGSIGTDNAKSIIDTMSLAINFTRSGQRIILPKQSCYSTDSVVPYEKDGFVAIAGHPYWKDQALTSIAKKQSQSVALYTAYERYKERLVDFLYGSFCFIIADPLNRFVLAGIDRFGQSSLYYTKNNFGIIFGSTADSILAHPSIERRLSNQGIYNYFYFHMVPSTDSIYANIKKLQAGCILFQNGDDICIKRYWQPSFEEQKDFSFTQSSQDLRQALKDSVMDCIDDIDVTGAFLSGGLDSSTVAGYLSEATEKKSSVYSIGFSAEGYDEMEYARLTAKHFGNNLHEYYVTPEDVFNTLPLIATAYDEPFGNSSALPSYFCAKFAADDGIKRLLAGDGGDELFGGNERYSKQRIFNSYKNQVPISFRKYLIEPLISHLPNFFPLSSKAKNFLKQFHTPLPDRLQNYNFLHRHSPSEIFNGEFLHDIDENIPLDLLRNIYKIPDDCTILNRMLYMDWQFTLADNDLKKVNNACGLADLEVVYPLLDERVVTLSCRIPSNWKLKGNDLRYFYKRSLEDWLPSETLKKKKHGFGLPFGVWMKTYIPLQNLAYDSVLSLKKYPYFQHSFLNSAIDLHRTGHASYYGELIWILTILSIWMDYQNKI